MDQQIMILFFNMWQRKYNNKQKGENMTDRVIYKLTEYNSSTDEEKIVYGHTKQSLEDEMPTVSEDQEITEINFNANDMESLCDALNNADVQI